MKLAASILVLLGYAILPTLTGEIRLGRNINQQYYRRIRSNMQLHVNPCVDYYAYACGNWKYHHQQEDYYEIIGFVDFKVNQELARMLKLTRRNNHYWQHKFVRDFHEYQKACLTVAEYNPIRYLDWLSREENIAWPSVGSQAHRWTQQPEPSEWLWMLATLRKYGFNGIIVEESILARFDDAHTYLVDIDKPIRNGGFKPIDGRSFRVIMDYLGIKGKTAHLWWDEVHLFEQELQELADRPDETDQTVISLEDLNMPWLERYLSIVMEVQVNPKMEITIQNMPYFKALQYVLDQHENEIICRYLMIRFVMYLHVEGPRNFLKADCITHTRGVMPLTVNWLYDQYHPEIRMDTGAIRDLFHRIVQQFKVTLNRNTNHFSGDILSFLHAKADKMQVEFGNLPRNETTATIEEYYHDLNLNRSDFYINHLRAIRQFTRAEHLNLQKASCMNTANCYYLEDTKTASSSSPYYLLRWNTVIVPLTLLHSPVYDANLHEIFKYSLLGYLLAHEITHGFDESGVEFDAYGNMRGPAGAIKSNHLFDNKLACLRSKYPNSMDEKIADVNGLRLVYEAFFHHTNMTQLTKSLRWAGLPKRLFFLNFAQFFCGMADEENFDFGEHGPDRQRVLDTLTNFAEFAHVYNCPQGSPMNPRKKCQLWR